MTDRKKNWKGMNWIRQEKRLAIYLRDGLACAYCSQSVEDGVQLSLDHIKPHSKGGSNHESNLVTCCCKCNSSRADRSLKAFAKATASYLNHGVTAEQIVKHVKDCAKRPLAGPHHDSPMAQAKRMIARRGSAARVLAAYQR